MTLNDKEIREVFHFLFLEKLLRISTSGSYVLKGGVNLRFFLKSPRYSEDMDLDVLGGSVSTLKKNGYKILEDVAFQRTLATYGIVQILINDPAKAKQTDTTQRFRVRLVNQAGEEYPTKIEFSRRKTKDATIEEIIDPSIASQYKRISFRCRHYSGESAASQKIRALTGRTEVQSRDAFDLYLLHLGGHVQPFKNKSASERLASITYPQYRDQVEEYLSPQGRMDFGGRKNWDHIQTQLLDVLS